MTSQPLQIEREASGAFEGCCTLWLDQGESTVIVLDRDLVERLDRALDRVPSDARGLVLASRSSRVFVAGADLRTILHDDDATLHEYLAFAAGVFGKLSSLAMPTVAAIGGAALGGGLELAMHCDALVGAPSGKPYPIGLPEASLRICPGWGGTNLLPARMEPGEAIRRTARGETMTFEHAASAGLFDRVCESAGELLEAARALAVAMACPARDGAPSRWIGRDPGAVLRALESIGNEFAGDAPGEAIVECVRAGLEGGWGAACACEREHLVRLRRTDEGRSAIEAFFARGAKK